MCAPALAAQLLQLALVGAVAYEAEARVEGRSSSSAVGDDEVDAAPRLAAHVAGTGWSLAGEYEPHLVTRGLARDEVATLQRAALRGSAVLARAWRGSARVAGSAGATNLLLERLRAADSPEAAIPDESGQPLPEILRMRRAAVVASSAVVGTLDRRSQLLLSAHAGVDLALDAAGRAALPRIWSGGVAAGHRWTLLRRTDLASLASLDVVESPVSRNAIAQVGEKLSHEFGRGGAVWASAGPALIDAWREGRGRGWYRRGHGELGLGGRGLLPGLDAAAAVRVAPAVDRISSNLVDRCDASASLSWAFARGWVGRVSGLGGVVLGGSQGGQRIVTADAGVTWSSDARGWSFTLAAARTDQAGGPPDVPALGLWSGGITASYRTRDTWW